MQKCKSRRVLWAIFSDLYGILFPNQKRGWYEKAPNSVSESEFKALARDFDRRLRPYEEILFYHHPARFHRLYKRLIKESKLRSRITPFTRLHDIV